MKKTKIWQALEVLAPSIRSRFMDFTASPYFNTSQRLTNLLEVILLHIDGVDTPAKDTIWMKMETGRVFNEVLFRKYCSNLLKLLERFLAIESFQERPLTMAAHRLRQVGHLKIKPLYASATKSADKAMKNTKEQGVDFMMDAYLVERFRIIILEQADRTQALDVDGIMEGLDRFYIAQRLTYYSYFMSQKRLVQRDYNLYFIDEILSHLERHPSRSPQVNILHLMAKIYRTNDPSYFDDLQRMLVAHLDLFPEQEANEIIRGAINFLIGWANEGREGFLRRVYDLYLYALEQPFFYTNGLISQWIFMNIVHVALRLEEYDWCEHFIEHYADKLADEARDNAVRYNRARLMLYRKNFDEVISLLNQVEFEDMTYSLGAKSMLIATYYESEMFEVLFSFFDSFRAFLRRHSDEIPERRMKSYINLIAYTRRLMKIPKGDKDKLSKFEADVNNENPLGDRRWLLQMVERKRSRHTSY